MEELVFYLMFADAALDGQDPVAQYQSAQKVVIMEEPV